MVFPDRGGAPERSAQSGAYSTDLRTGLVTRLNAKGKRGKGPALQTLPPRMTCERSGDRVVLSRSWYTHEWIVPTCATALLLSTTVFDAPTLLTNPLFALAWAAILGSSSYYLLAKLFNRTWIVVDAERLVVRHVPIPWPSLSREGGWAFHQALERRCIEGLHTTEVCRRLSDGEHFWYRVSAELADGTIARVIDGVDGPTADYVMRAISEFWDVPIGGHQKAWWP